MIFFGGDGYFHPGAFREHGVGYDEINNLPGQEPAGLFPICGADHFMAGSAQDGAAQRGQSRVVLYQQNPRHSSLRLRPYCTAVLRFPLLALCSTSIALAAGKESAKVVPCPGRLAKLIAPPMRASQLRTKESPKPACPFLVV